MNEEEIKIGDVLRIRQWDDMKEEFGERNGHIRTPDLMFVNNMRRLCGKTFTVSKSMPYGASEMLLYRSEEGVEVTRDDESNQPFWYITAYMLERVDNPIEIDVASLFDAIFG